eukprot:gene1772-9497_t
MRFRDARWFPGFLFKHAYVNYCNFQFVRFANLKLQYADGTEHKCQV